MINLGNILELMDISHSDLGKRIGITQPAVSYIVKRGSTSVETALLIADELEVSLDYLCGRAIDSKDSVILKNKIKKISNICKT